jgi:hypothetical protein
MPHGPESVLIQRADRVRRLGPFRRIERRYRVRFLDGTELVLSLAGLDSLLDARRTPADFWACVHAADTAYAAGETLTQVEWPSSRLVAE